MIFTLSHTAYIMCQTLSKGGTALMQVVVVKSPRLMSCILRLLFKIKKDEESP